MKVEFRVGLLVDRVPRLIVAFLVVGLLAFTAVGQQTLEQGGSLQLTAGHLISRVTGRARVPLKADPIAFQLLQNPSRLFSEGERVGDGDNQQEWKQVTAAGNGQFQGREYSGSYLQFVVHSQQPQVVLLEANGHGAAVINGQPRTGDPYNKWQQLPIKIRPGKNQLLFQVGRGRFSGRLIPPEKPVYLTTGDTTLPSLLQGETQLLHAAMPLVNASEMPLSNLEIQTRVGTGPVCATSVGPVLPLSLRKIRFGIRPPENVAEGPLEVSVKLVQSNDQVVLDEKQVQLGVSDPGQRHQRTFVSRVDGSVQYYGVTPADGSNQQPAADSPGLVLSLHGAGVEGRRQAGVYQPKPDLHFVAPTNRRAFGFDWEDWGRIDALEVLEDAARHLEVDPRRIYLSGHSMGGHGTWQLGAHFPDRFAAIGPSAGWISFWTYAGGARDPTPSPVLEILQRAANPSDTLLMQDNYRGLGIYVLHGDRDNNVPVDQARQMRRVLGEFHPDFSYFEQPGAGHWWGNACVDWPPMIEFFRRHTLPAEGQVNRIDFTTVCPGNSARYGWATVIDQLVPLQASRIQLNLNRTAATLTGSTQNVRLLKLELTGPTAEEAEDNGVQLELDGDRIIAEPGTIWLDRSNGDWKLTQPPPVKNKNPDRYGLFKSAFDHQFVLVYSTGGTDDENRWSQSKARYDAETFWYRGNGSVDVVSDQEFNQRAYRERNVILYGNADTNRAWAGLLADCPLQVTRERATLGDRAVEDPRLAALFVYPRPDSERHLVGVVGGTGIEGLRATTHIRYFVSGIHFPDLTLVSADYLKRGTAALHATGFWDSSWQIEKAEIAWSETE